MRYLTCFRPPEELTSKLYEEKTLKIPPSGFHCTIWGFNIYEDDENNLVEILSFINAEPFVSHVTGYKRLTDFSFALNLKRNFELHSLHKEVVRYVRPIDKSLELFDNMVKCIGNGHYNPHITISKSRENPTLKKDYKGMQVPVNSYYLLKKKEGNWLEVAVFELGY